MCVRAYFSKGIDKKEIMGVGCGLCVFVCVSECMCVSVCVCVCVCHPMGAVFYSLSPRSPRRHPSITSSSS